MASRDFPPHNNLFITIGLAENRGGVIHGRTTSRDQLEKSAVTRRNDALCKVTQVGAHIYSSIPYEVRLLSRFLLLLACTDHVEVEEEQRCPAILERRRLSRRGSDRPRLEPLFSRRRYASQEAIQLRSILSVFQGISRQHHNTSPL